MAWTTTELVQLEILSTAYLFAPTEMRLVGDYDVRARQVTQEADAGQVKVIDLGASDDELYTFEVNRMQFADRTVGGQTIRGLSSLSSFVQVLANYRATTFGLWLPDKDKSAPNEITVRYWSSTFRFDFLRRRPNVLYGNGSQTITFRKEIT